MFQNFYKCENRGIPDYFKNMFLTHENTRRLKRIRWAPQRFSKWKLIFQTTIAMKLR